MLFGTLSDRRRYFCLDQKLKRCFEYAECQDLAAMEPGVYLIDAEDVFVNIVEYETTTVENRFWEAHRNYIDLHLMLRGRERVDLNFIHNMTAGTYKEKEDFLPLDGVENSHVELAPGDYLVCYPEDGHRTGLLCPASEKIKKAIFKVRL